jgi:hypothetical protein
MKTFLLLTVGLLSTAVTADPNGHHRKHDKLIDVECMRLLGSERVLRMSSDDKLMARLQKNYPDRAAKINDQKKYAQPNITAIQGNHPADWLTNCHAEGAQMRLKHQCMMKHRLRKMQKKWNDAKKGPEVQKDHGWTVEQFTEEKGVLDAKLKDLDTNKTLSELCVKLPKGGKGGKGDKGDGKDGKDGKADGKSDKGGKTPDGKAADGKAADGKGAGK